MNYKRQPQKRRRRRKHSNTRPSQRKEAEITTYYRS